VTIPPRLVLVLSISGPPDGAKIFGMPFVRHALLFFEIYRENDPGIRRFSHRGQIA
jgi:hypothetical protein